MKKTIPLLLLFVLLFLCLSSCSKETEESLSSASNDIDSSGCMITSTPLDCSALEALMRCQAVTEEATSFSAALEGTCDTQVLFFNYRQSLRSERFVNSEAMFSQSISTSSLVRVGVQQFFQDDIILVRSGEVHSMEEVVWEERPVSVTPESYQLAYGNTPHVLSNYRLEEATILSANFTAHSEQTYTFVYELDPVKSTEAYARQIQTMGGLDTLPIFQSITMTVTMDEAFRPLSVRYQEVYDISIQILGNTTCKTDYTEVFSDFEASVTLPEQTFFTSFLKEEITQNYPEISSGYTFLFSLLGNSNSYNLTVVTSEQTFPFHLSLDAYSNSVLLHATDFDFLYLDNRYYFSAGNARVYTDAEAFNEQILPLTSLSSAVLSAQGGSSILDLLSKLNITTENGVLVLKAEDESMSFSASVDMQSMSLLSAELNVSVFGSLCQILLEKSPLRATLPDLQGYQDITSSVSAFSLIGKLANGDHFDYGLDVSGDFSFSAKLTVSLSESSISMISSSSAFPLSVYYTQDTVSALWDEISISGELSDFIELLSLFSGDKTVSPDRKISSVLAEPGKLRICFDGDSSAELTFAGSYILFTTEAFSVRLTSQDSNGEPAAKAPETPIQLPVSQLKTFLLGSIYPELFTSGTIVCNIEAQHGDNQSYFELCIATAPKLSFGLTTVWNDLKTDFIYTDETYYLSNSVINAFLDADQLHTVSDRLLALFGEQMAFPIFQANDLSITSVSCDAEQLSVSFGNLAVIFGKTSFRLSGDRWEITGSGFSCSPEAVSFAYPDKQNCVDLYALTERLESLKQQTYFSFTGGFSNADLSASVSRLDFKMGTDGKPSAAALDVSLNGLDTHRYQVIYDGESIYFDAGGTKLFCLADRLIAPLSQISKKETVSFLSLTDLYSITYQKDVLTLETTDALLSITWEEDEISQLLYASKAKKLLLKKAVYTPILSPSMDGYADISPIGDLLAAVYATADSGSFSFSGQIDLQALSMSLSGIKAEGAFVHSKTGWDGYLSIDVPFLYGMTSADISMAQGFRILHSCSIHTDIYLQNGNLYLQRIIQAQYGLFQSKTITMTATAYQSVEEFLCSPAEVISFACNLEDNISKRIMSKSEQDPAEFSLLKRFSCEGDRYVMELNPDAILPAADSLSVSLETDGTYLTGAEASCSLSILSIIASGTFTEHGQVDLFTLPQDFSAYPLLHS